MRAGECLFWAFAVGEKQERISNLLDKLSKGDWSGYKTHVLVALNDMIKWESYLNKFCRIDISEPLEISQKLYKYIKEEKYSRAIELLSEHDRAIINALRKWNGSCLGR